MDDDVEEIRDDTFDETMEEKQKSLDIQRKVVDTVLSYRGRLNQSITLKTDDVSVAFNQVYKEGRDLNKKLQTWIQTNNSSVLPQELKKAFEASVPLPSDWPTSSRVHLPSILENILERYHFTYSPQHIQTLESILQNSVQ